MPEWVRMWSLVSSRGLCRVLMFEECYKSIEVSVRVHLLGCKYWWCLDISNNSINSTSISSTSISQVGAASLAQALQNGPVVVVMVTVLSHNDYHNNQDGALLQCRSSCRLHVRKWGS
jgi:hypothetical protein